MDEPFVINEGDELLMHNFETLPDRCKKYWKKRYQLFSKFDDGVYMTAELWFSVTPEDVASFTAKLVAHLLPDCKDILDICCGGGGNLIQFANLFETVGAVDINRNNLYCTKHNSGIYNVEEKIWTHLGDWHEMAPINGTTLKTDWIPKHILARRAKEGKLKPFDCVFLSPPWGGPKYAKERHFDLYKMEPFSVETLAKQMIQYSDNYMMFLPRNLDLDQLAKVTRDVNGESSTCRILYVTQWGKRIALLALWGPQFSEGDIDYAEIFPEDHDESLDVEFPGDEEE